MTGFAETFEEGTCDGTVRDWTITVVPEQGSYKDATASSSWFALGCIDDGDYCSGAFAEQRLRLHAAG